jgi:hypothetical protein
MMKKLILLASVALLAIPYTVQADLVQGWEFNGADTEGWAAVNTDGLSAAVGLLTGVAANNDPQLTLTAIGLNPGAGQTWDTLEFRVRETRDVDDDGGAAGSLVDTFQPTGLAVTNGGNVITSAALFSASALDVDNFFTVTVDISQFNSDTWENVRLDPIGGANSNSNSQTAGNTFEVDYIRIYDTGTAVPEPTSLAVLGIGVVGMVVRRKKRIT